MDFTFTQDQEILLDALATVIAPHRTEMPKEDDFVLRGDAVRAKLEEAGFIALIEQGLTPFDAVLAIEKIAELPHALEVGASMLIAPMTGVQAPAGPIALLNSFDAPARHLPDAAAIFVRDREAIRYGALPANAASTERSLYAYPIGRLSPGALDGVDLIDVDAKKFWTWSHIAAAAEISGTMRSALAVTVDYVKTRVQFGRPIGVFQTIQHRLAEAAVYDHSARLLVYRAAESGQLSDAVDAIVAAKEAARLLAYETQQFHGAIGLTLEHPLHCWTYKLRWLIGELGAAAAIGATNVDRLLQAGASGDVRVVFESL